MHQDSALRLIIVDDSLDDAEAYNKTLRTLGYAIKSTRVEEPEQLSDALNWGEQDLVLLSLDPPDLELPDVARQIENLKPELPIIALAGGSSDHPIERVLRDGAVDLVRKDNPDHLRFVVQRELEHVRRVRQITLLDTSYRDTEKRCRVLMESSRDAIAYVHEGMHVYANEAYLDVFGFASFEGIEGTPIMDMVPGEEQNTLKQFLRNHSKSPEAEDKLQTQLKQANGSVFTGQMELSRATIDGEACTQIVIRDQTTSKELERQITELSRIDQLTGLFNRQHIIQLLQEAVAVAKGGSSQPAAVFLLSLDEISVIKSRLGVLGSDRVSSAVAAALKNALPEQVQLARFEGSIFAALAPMSEEQMEKLAESTLKLVERHISEVGENSVTTTASIGLCAVDENTANANEVLSRAERALAEADRHGGNRLVVYKQKAGERSQKQIDQEWAKTLKQALQKNQFKLLYQPIVALSGDGFERYEVVVRLTGDKGEEIPLDEFVPAAERTGLSKSLDRWVILNSLKKLVIILKKRPKTVLFLKLGTSALEDGELFRWIHDRVKALKLPQGSLVFQFSEEASLAHLRQARAFAFALHKINCKIGLDDFGTGPNPFQLLKHVPADYLRMKQEYTQDLLSNEENQTAIRNITSKCRELNKLTIAPNVEDAGSLSILWSSGVDMIQGEFLQGPSEKTEYDFTSMAV